MQISELQAAGRHGRLGHWKWGAEDFFDFIEHSCSILLHHLSLPLCADAMPSEQCASGVVHEEAGDLRLATALRFSCRRHMQVSLT